MENKQDKKESQHSDVNHKEIEHAIFAQIALTLQKGQSVTIRNFGTFTIKTRKARKGVNPKTSASIMIAKQQIIKFNSCKKLKQAVNGKK